MRSLIVIISILFSSVSAFANLIDNGSFETINTQWHLTTDSSVNASAIFDYSESYNGSNCAQIIIDQTSDDSSDVFLQIPFYSTVEYRKVYKLSFQLKTAQSTNFSVIAFDSLNTGIEVFKQQEFSSFSDGNWHEFSFYYTSEQEGEASLKFGLILGYDTATIQLDEFVLEIDNSYFPEPVSAGAYTTNYYRNLFTEAGKTTEQVQTKSEQIFNQLFYGNNKTQRVYYQISDSLAYILDTYNEDIRSEGMSYGMMIAVQMNKKFEFDCLWNFAKTHMQHQSGARKGYFSWSYDPKNMQMNDKNSAPDGEEYFAMALFFAAHRWGNGEGIYDYETEANQLLYDMLHLEERNGGVVSGLTNMFDLDEKKIVFVPQWDNADFSDPSYHLPAFYELWAKWAKQDNDFWAATADTSRAYLQRAMHPNTGFTTDYMTFDAKPKSTSFNDRSDDFSGDSWRVAMNVAMDCNWWGHQNWHSQKLDSLLEFMSSKGNSYQSQYTQSGELLSPNWEGSGFYAMNAVAPLGAKTQNSWNFINKFWSLSLPTGTYRYYDGLLYMLAYLNVSGEYKIWKPGDEAITPKPETPEIIIFNPFATEPEPEETGLIHESKSIKTISSDNSIEIINNSNEQIRNIQLLDITGKLIKAITPLNHSQPEPFQYNSSPGIYMLVIETNERIIPEKIFIRK